MLKEGSFVKAKFGKFFLASVLGWVVSLLGGMADSIIAGIYLDADAVSAVSLITPISAVVYFIALSVSLGCAVMYSRCMGAFEIEKSGKVAGMGLYLSIGLGVLIALILFVFKENILRFYGVEGALYDYSMAYFIPVIIFSSFYPVFWTLYYLIDYDGDESIILWVDILLAVLNTVFSFVLIQKIGIAGLGYGTLLSDAVGLLVMLLHFRKKTNSIRFTFHFSFKDLIEVIKLSSATSLTTLYMGVIDIVFNKLVIDRFGADYLTAYAVVNVVMNFAAVLICAINSGNVFVTVAYGERNPFAIRRVMKTTNLYTIGTSVVLAVIMEVLAGVWPALFAIEEGSAVYSAALYAGRIIPLFFPAAGFVYTYVSFYSYTEHLIEGNILSICYMLLGPIVLSIPLAYAFDFNAMSLGFGLSPVFALAAAALYILCRKQFKKLPYILDDVPDCEAHFDLRIDTAGITEVRDRIGTFLTEQNVSPSVINKVQLVFEDSAVFIAGKNKKPVICEATILVNDERVKLITKDNGMVFNILDEADNCVDLRAYVLARMAQDAKEAANSTTISFNRNIYVWDRKAVAE